MFVSWLFGCFGPSSCRRSLDLKVPRRRRLPQLGPHRHQQRARVAARRPHAGAGAQGLNDGLVDSAAFIDMVAVHGLGFARRTGGVMFAADLLGLEQVRKIILEASQRSPLISPPSPIFQDLINAEENFGTIDV